MVNSATSAALILDTTIATHRAYIYAIAAMPQDAATALLYIGQTISLYGALGRLAQHFSITPGRTFLNRAESLGANTSFDRISLKTFALPANSNFLSKATDYREAVEAFAQTEATNYIVRNRLPLTVISRCRPNPYIKQEGVQDTAEKISAAMQAWLHSPVF